MLSDWNDTSESPSWIGMTRVKVRRSNASTLVDSGAEGSDKPGAGPIRLQNGQRLGP